MGESVPFAVLNPFLFSCGRSIMSFALRIWLKFTSKQSWKLVLPSLSWCTRARLERLPAARSFGITLKHLGNEAFSAAVFSSGG